MTAAAAPRAARPFVKWAGGKTALLPELDVHAPERFGRYFEPFVGGGAFFFHLAARMPPQRGVWAILGDRNKALITTYKCIRTDVHEVVTQLFLHERSHTRRKEKFYYDLRADEPTDAYEVAARFVALNKLCFNGLYRVNRLGKYNVPYGKWKSAPTVCDEINLCAVARVLKGAALDHGDFEEIVLTAARGDFVYFDPPYIPVSATSNFTAYAKEPFGPLEQERLRDCALRLKRKGVRVLLSNADVPLARKLYARGFDLRRVESRRGINSNTGKRGLVGELLVW